MLHKSYLG